MLLKRRNVEIVETDEIRIKELMRDGFVPLEPCEEPETKGAGDLYEMSVKELREYAFLRGIQMSKSLRKKEIIELLEGADD